MPHSQYFVFLISATSEPFILRTDASGTGLGAVLLQEKDGKKFPIAYASRKLSSAEKRYAITELECLAIVWAINKFQKYLYGREFVLETDHQALSFMNQAKLTNSRVMRWALTLQPFKFHVQVLPGKENIGADFLSRVC